MSDLALQKNHLFWQQRLNKETKSSKKFNDVVEVIRESRPENHKTKAIKPFRVLPKG